MIEITLQYGGKMTSDPVVPYVNGIEVVHKGFDVDKLSLIEMGKLVNNEGVVSFKGLWYRHFNRMCPE